MSRSVSERLADLGRQRLDVEDRELRIEARHRGASRRREAVGRQLAAQVEGERAQVRVLQVRREREGMLLLADPPRLGVADDADDLDVRARSSPRPMASRSPMAERPGKNLRAIVSLTMATLPVRRSSSNRNSRPATSGMPSVEKYCGPTWLRHTRMPLVCSFSGPDVRTLLVSSLPVIEATSAAETERTPGDGGERLGQAPHELRRPLRACSRSTRERARRRGRCPA